MLFDLEDYKGAGIIGVARKSVEDVYWGDSYITWRVTHDAYRKAVNEWFLASNVMASVEDKHQLMVNYININDKFTDSFRKGKIFFNALCSKSIPAEIVSANGIVEGTTLRIFNVGQGENWYNEFIDLPNLEYPQQWGGSGNKYVLFIGEYSPNGYSELTGRGESFVYTTMTQAIYNAHKNALVDLQAKIKETYIIAEGISDIPEWIEPDVHPWYDSAELSGYVRDSRSLPISGAKVRLVDAEGVNHDLVTNDLGYYQFTKEYIYNNISFGTASSVEFDMFVLEETISGTLLYDKTSIFQNSFFGAVNNRDFTWPVLVKDGKPNRRNFKIEYISDYSNFPSFSGYVKDAAGNPIKDAFVMIKDGNTGYCIGNYKKPNGDIAMNFKYNYFGVDRTILTDENGFYEYTSQMVGEWFNKEFMQVGEVAGNLGGRVFDDYFGSREDLIWSYDNYSQINLQYKESFFALLIPYKQDVNSNSVDWEGTPLYDNNDYYASRFKYALTSYNEFNYQRIDLDTHYDIDVDVTVATNDEFRADKFTVELLSERKNVDSGLSSQTRVNTTSGYFKVVYPATGESYFVGNGYYYSYSHLNINYGNADDYKDFYFYSCDSQGRAMGYIKEINTPSFTKTIDLSGLKYLRVFNPINFYGESINFSGMKYLEEISMNNSSSLKNIIGLESKKAYSLSLFKLSALENIDISGLTGLTSLNFEYLPALQSLNVQSNTKLQSIYIRFVDVELNVAGLTMLNNIDFDKLTMTSDDVDNLLTQLASISADQEGNNVMYGNINIKRIARSSYSDDAYATLMQRSWNINLGSYFYDEEIVPDRLIIEADPSLASSNESINMNSNWILTTTGYWIGKLWTGVLIGNTGYVNSASIDSELRLGTTDARVEIFSCNEYGVPEGEITHIELNHPKIKNVDTSELASLVHFGIAWSPGNGVAYSNIESLDLTYNTSLLQVHISGSNIESIDLTGLTSLENLSFNYCPNLIEAIGIPTLSSLENFGLNSLTSFDYVSLAAFDSLKNVFIDEVDLYDSTHVDAMLADLKLISDDRASALNTLLANKSDERDVKLAELSAFDAQEPTISTLNTDLDILNAELNQLISDGADQSLIDAKQAEVDAKAAEIAAKEFAHLAITEQIAAIDSEISQLNYESTILFSSCTINTAYMARTSASDVDYDSLATYGWNLQLGSEFIGPYTEPLKGFVTYDWTTAQNGDSSISLSNALALSSTTGFVKYVSGIYSGVFSVNTSDWTYPSYTAAKGVTEFWSCDSHGRPTGSIIAFGHSYQSNECMKSFDISNLTEIKKISLYAIRLSSIDLSSNINIEEIMIGETFNKLESIVGFENLVNLKDIHITTQVSKLDIPVDFTSMPNLQRIQLHGLGIDKSSRLNVSGLTKLQILNVYWVNMISADLDNALLNLDAAGLDSEFDFNYEGHLTHLGTEISLTFGMGINYHPEYASDFNSLQSKGWNLSVGNQIIDSIEDPTKGIVRWSADTEWAALQFGFVNGSGSIIANLPDGTIQNSGSMISYSFDSSVPVEDRFIEFWAVDSYGRPNRSISGVADLWNTGITSLEVKNMTNIGEININNSKIQSLDVSGMPNLENVYLNGSEDLESVIIAGCSKIRLLLLDSCPNLDIEQLLQDLDNIVSVSTSNTKRLVAPSSVVTSAVEDEIESLIGKGWGIRVKEPASAPVIFNVAGGNTAFEVGTSTGCVKVIFATGSSMHQSYPDGWIQNHGGGDWAFSLDNISSSYYSYDANSFTGQISIISVGYNQADGSYFDSGKVRYTRNYGNGSFDYTTTDSLKVAVISNATQADITSIGDLNLEKLTLQNVSNSLNLSNSFAKSIDIDGGSLNEILFNNNTIKQLRMYAVSGLNSIDLAGATMSELEIQGTNIENIELPADLRLLSINSNTTWSGDLDLSGLESLVGLQLNELPLISSIDITNLSNLKNINLYKANCPIIGLETTSVEQLQHSGLDMTNYEIVLPTTIINVNISSDGLQSLIVTSATGSAFKADGNISIGDYNSFYNNSPISTLVIPNNMKYYTFARLSFVPDISSLNPQAEVNFIQPKVSTIDLQDIELQRLVIRDDSSSTDQYIETINLSGSVTELRLETMGWYGWTYNSPGRGLSGDISNLTCNTLSVNYMYNFGESFSIHPDTQVFIYGGRGLNLSGKTLKKLDISWFNGGSINLSNATIAENVDLNYCNYVTSMNLDGLNAKNLNISYCSAGNEYWNNYSGPNSFAVSLVSAVIRDNMWINYNRMLSAINATDASIRYVSITECFGLTSLAVSLKGTNEFGFYMRSEISSITLTDAVLGTLLNYIDISSNHGISPAASIVDSVINAVSETNRTGKTLRLKNMSARTSASQTAYSKLIGQSWNLMNV